MATPTTVADARNRALRTFLQGLGIDLLAAVAVTVYTVVSTGPNVVAWSVLGAAVCKTLLTSGASYVMRLKLDPLNPPVPTPLPPADPGPPAETPVPQGLMGHVGHRVVPQEPGVADHGEEGPRSEAARHAALNEPDTPPPR